MGFSVMLWGAEKLVPAEYWWPYGTRFYDLTDDMLSLNRNKFASFERDCAHRIWSLNSATYQIYT